MGELNAPFRGSDAVAAGVMTKHQLRGPGYRRLFSDIYLPSDLAPTLAVRSRGAQLLVAGHGALAGYSAAELLAPASHPVTPTPRWWRLAAIFGSAAGFGCIGSNSPRTRSRRSTD